MWITCRKHWRRPWARFSISSDATPDPSTPSGKIPAAKLVETQRLIFNQRLDAAVTVVLAAMILILLIEAVIQWVAILTKQRTAVLHEAPYVATAWTAEAEGD